MRLFARAVRRAGLEIDYSQGYNPKPRLSLTLPRPVGLTSQTDLLVVDLPEPIEPGEFCRRLAQHLPAGIEMTRDFRFVGRAPQPVVAEYCLQLPPESRSGLDRKIKDIMQKTKLPVERLGKKSGRTQPVDIRKYLERLEFDSGELSFSVSCGPGGSAKPAEVLALLDLDTPANRVRLTRRKVQYAGLAVQR